jgi:cytidine deaminase
MSPARPGRSGGREPLARRDQSGALSRLVHGNPSGERMAELVRLAGDAARRAHAPYSGFAVGAVLCDEQKALFQGANIENAAYPLGICAERAALLAWREAGGAPIDSVVIYTDTLRPTPPCGLCREALLHWAPGANVYLAYRRSVAGPFCCADLLPMRGSPGGSG